MANAKRHKHLHPPPPPHHRTPKQQQQRPATTTPKPRQKSKKQKQQQQTAPAVIHFAPLHRILLLGEGDVSFAASLVRHHRCRHVTATVREKDHAALLAKYPAAETHIAALLEPPPPFGEENGHEDEEGDGEVRVAVKNDTKVHSRDDIDRRDHHDSLRSTENPPPATSSSSRILYDVDATKPPPSLLRPPHYDRIVFNFPHVGGLSTDTNRQVRHNQALLVAFFQRTALPALAPRGAILVTLFEVEPYTLWNVRDLARHAGLAVERSFAFRPDVYPGYRHARTAGHARLPDSWKGALRTARTYIFRRKEELMRDDALAPGRSRRKNKKRPRGEETSSSDDDSDHGQQP